jgi:hypothetical protein
MTNPIKKINSKKTVNNNPDFFIFITRIIVGLIKPNYTNVLLTLAATR